MVTDGLVCLIWLRTGLLKWSVSEHVKCLHQSIVIPVKSKKFQPSNCGNRMQLRRNKKKQENKNRLIDIYSKECPIYIYFSMANDERTTKEKSQLNSKIVNWLVINMHTPCAGIAGKKPAINANETVQQSYFANDFCHFLIHFILYFGVNWQLFVNFERAHTSITSFMRITY